MGTVQIALTFCNCHNQEMLGYFDESGDPGVKIANRSSRYFVVALVTLDENDVALQCDRQIDELRRELPVANNYEFHFANNSKRVRETFLEAVHTFAFQYHLFALDKDPGELYRLSFDSGNELYRYVAGRVVENASPYLRDASVTIDKRGDRRFRRELSQQLRRSATTRSGERAIRRIKYQDSRNDNLLQLADYVVSIGNRAMLGRKDAVELWDKYLKRKEVTRQIWPR